MTILNTEKQGGRMNYDELSDDIRGRTGQFKTTCKNCIKLGKDNAESDTSLSINTDMGVYKCHRCGLSGGEATKPENVLELASDTGLTEGAYMFLYRRGFSDDTIKYSKVQMDSSNKSIAFPFFYNGRIVKTKFRGVEEKTFHQSKESRPTLYNYDNCMNYIDCCGDLVITEGEIDALSFREVGITSSSVDMGALNKGDKGDGKLQCIENSFDLIEKATTIYIAVDNDPNGERLEKELIRRCGAEKCKIVDFKPWKDANEVLVYEGAESLLERFKSAKDVKVEGIYTGEEDIAIMDHHWEHGLPKGTTTYVQEIDKHWTWRPTDINLWTGYMNEGKSTLLRQLALFKSVNDGSKWGVYAKEDYPRYDMYTDLIEMYVGMTTDIDKPYRRMTRKQYEEARKFVMAHFIMFQPKKKPNIYELSDFTTYCVRKYGIYGAWFDPYIGISHDVQKYGREDLYISEFSSIVKDCAVRNEIPISVVAHQVTPKRIESKDEYTNGCYPRPNVYTVKGGGTFADAFDNVISVWRPRYAVNKTDPTVIFESQKIKKQKLVGIPGAVEMEYDSITSRYRINGFSPLDEIKVVQSLDLPGESTNLDIDNRIANFLNQSR